MSHNDISHVLGKKTEYRFTYNPEVLAREPRVRNRLSYGFDNDTVPWKVGFDAWHEYEASFLTEKGLPVNGILKIIVPADSEFIVESKSLKLYLFSFNMQRLGKDQAEAIDIYLSTVKTDLEKLLEVNISLQLFTEEMIQPFTIADPILNSMSSFDSVAHTLNLEYTEFNENPDTLKLYDDPTTEDSYKRLRGKSSLLRSNCKITNQADWGDVYIYLRGKKLPTVESLLRYLISMRKENHFHEEIVECIYARLWSKFEPTDLLVTALYTRRGGIDICPSRASDEKLLPPVLINSRLLTPKAWRS